MTGPRRQVPSARPGEYAAWDPAVAYACRAPGCGHRGPLTSVRPALRGEGVYCIECSAIERAVLFSYHPEALLVQVLDELRASADAPTFVPPFPSSFPCVVCRPPRGREARPALPGTLTCSPRCQQRAALVHRTLNIVRRGGIALPESLWRALLDLRGSGYRMRRQTMGVIDALARPVSRRHRSAGRAAGAATQMRRIDAAEAAAAAVQSEHLRAHITHLMPRVRP